MSTKAPTSFIFQFTFQSNQFFKEGQGLESDFLLFNSISFKIFIIQNFHNNKVTSSEFQSSLKLQKIDELPRFKRIISICWIK